MQLFQLFIVIVLFLPSRYYAHEKIIERVKRTVTVTPPVPVKTPVPVKPPPPEEKGKWCAKFYGERKSIMIQRTGITSYGTINKSELKKLSSIEVRNDCALKLFNGSNMDSLLATFTGYNHWIENSHAISLSYNCQCDDTSTSENVKTPIIYVLGYIIAGLLAMLLLVLLTICILKKSKKGKCCGKDLEKSPKECDQDMGEIDDGCYYGPSYENLDVDGNLRKITPKSTPSQSPDHGGSMQTPALFFQDT